MDSYSDITTTGDSAYGITGASQTTGFPREVLTGLEQFTNSGFNFTLTSVDGSSTNIGHAVQGVLVDTNGTATGGTGGTFIVSADGSFTFSLGNGFTNMAIGTTQQVIATFSLAGSSSHGTNLTTGAAIAEIIRTTNGFIVAQGAYSDTYGSCLGTNSAVPDLTNYVAGLIGVAKAGGAGNSVSITNRGSITTSGTAAQGIFAQSLGGNGGYGSHGSISHRAGAGGTGSMGGNVEVEANGLITTTGLQACAVAAVSMGGNGGHGGDGGFWRYDARGGNGTNGGAVLVTGNGTLNMYGDQGIGIFALSQGGCGGEGGSGKAFTGGGNGGFGGQGSNVIVAGSWDITTRGSGAYGIWAKSAGGNAGSGGSGGWLAGAPGSGGMATDGGTVTVSSAGTITNYGQNGIGIYAESVGGFGGAGGTQTGIFYSHGGDGSSAGSGGEINVTQEANGRIFTYGTNAHGILAESVGGGGGGSGGVGDAIAGVGGQGGAGGFGGTVNVTNYGQITTMSEYSRDIFAQSVGGGGGDGGSGGGVAGIGGSGNGSSPGGLVTVANYGSITTTGRLSDAIFAQSVGGGSGSAGSGGSGNSGGSGGTVTVLNADKLDTHGVSARGIVAQSVGGGGGDGGTGSGLVGVGGSGSGTSPGGNVSVVNSGEITTAAEAIFAESIGGGGGNGGSSDGWFSFGGSGAGGGNGGTVAVNNSGHLATFSDNADAIFAQSVGGGGGNGGNSVAVGLFVSVAIGGTAGDGGSGNVVNVTSGTNSIETHGNNSHGILAQSVGGGGGNGGFAFSGSVGTDFSAAVGIGGKGGKGGNGINVVVNSASAITTQGTNAHAIFAQSVGGGGGSGGFSIAVTGSQGPSLSLSIGGGGGSGGDGEAVRVTSSGELQTFGERSYGILAQSVGGGGGDGGFSIAAPLSFGGSNGVGGMGSTVYVDSASTITTYSNYSHGIMAQSVGGGGGSGGFSIAGGVSSGASLGLSFGAAGGAGGSSSNVTVKSMGDITTYGDRSYGIMAQSVGGGSGGFSVAGSISTEPAASLSMGGNGGKGGNGGEVNLESGGSIATFGPNAHAIFAQSVGGGGGSGGFSVAGTISANSAALGASLGGNGDGGGGGGNVAVNTTGASIMTAGDHSYGVLAQSVGGGGGDGGFSVAAGASKSASVNLAMGGNAKDGGNGGSVLVTNASIIVTSNSSSHAIFAQSVGGGGGSGGFSVAGSLSASSGAVSASLGGTGGGGGSASNVVVKTTGVNIMTYGGRSYGVLAQSVGGGGGDSGFSVAGSISKSASVSLSLGGSGGPASTAGTVNVESSSAILTMGNDSHGLFAQSVGGGGGSGGFSVAGSISAESAAVGASIGGSGGSGGNAGAVRVTSSGQIDTFGDHSDGILAQSIGGGGGDGAFSVAGGISKGPSLNFAIGGSGGNGGSGGAVSVTSASNVATRGKVSMGILAQSVGGGGGSGGFTISGSISKDSGGLSFSLGGAGGPGSSAGDVNVLSKGQVVTTNEGSHAIVAQSIGGGGGNGGFAGSLVGGFGQKGANLSVSIGGSGGIGGSAGSVGVTNAGTIWTDGNDAYGILAQSIGGGGGNGGFGLAANLGSGDKSIGLDVAIGGNGATGGVASAVTVLNQGQITTVGSNSFGIFAQSVGGGGNGGFSAAGSLSTSTNANQINVSVGGHGGVGNDSGRVIVGNYSNIVTYGQAADGILAQSIGGGGGNGGASYVGSFTQEGSRTVAVAVGGNGGAGGNGNLVVVTNAGGITTYSNDAHGIFAQSVGGGGGRGGSSTTIAWSAGSASSNSVSLNFDFSIGGSGGAAGNGSNVVVVNQGQISTEGKGAYGIFAQSVGGGGSGGDAKIEQRQPGLSDITNLLSSVTASVTETNKSTNSESHSLSVNVGAGFDGKGGAAGTGGNVTVNNDGSIQTSGDKAIGIFAQSVGGGGGVGGSSSSDTGGGSGDRAIGINLNIGGAGGGGDSADTVTVTSTGSIITKGDDSHGIMAQSVGGGGGAGGASSSTIAGSATNTTLTFNANINIGGDGSVGGDGGAVIVTNQGLIDTSGATSYGILAQSIGGGGGFGGDTKLSHAQDDSGGGSGDSLRASAAPSATVTNENSGEDKSWSLSISVGSGGNAGGGGKGGAVTVNNLGDIITRGTNSVGIFAQSVGGGGGTGGSSGTETGGSGADRALDVGVSLGGQGGDGGGGGAVTVMSEGSIIALGDDSHAIMAQSVGGGGGTGGASVSGLSDSPSNTNSTLNVTVGIGGTGGLGGSGSNVVVFNQGRIDTWGRGAYGILAQSIGGGGGFGGDARVEPAGDGSGGSNAVASALASATEGTHSSKNWNINVSVAVGGAAGGSGAGGSVSVTNSGGITTHGEAAHAIFAQSVGEGGGVGGASVFTAGSNSPTTLNIGVGGGGGSGKDGGTVTVVNQGAIETWGSQSYGILAQSIGGGGGRGGSSGMTNAAGSTNWSVSLTFGGNGAGAANGGDVTVDNSGDVTTHGDNAHGIFAQSVGGGGGDGGYGSHNQSDGSSTQKSLGVEVGGSAGSSGNGGNVMVRQAGDVTTVGNGTFGVFAQSVGGGGGVGGAGELGATGNIGLGGAGGAGGNGGEVKVDLTGTITTYGLGTYGIFAQSIGGGGGLAGNLDQGLSTGLGGSTNLGVGLAFGRSGGNGGNGGAVTVHSAGRIITYGDGSCGIFAQSVGGGGGAAGSLNTSKLTLNSAGSAGAAGSGGKVTINHTGDIYTYGNNSHGIFIQSAGGQDAGGKINLELIGSIHVEGTNSDAVYVQSVGGQKNDDMSVTLLNGAVEGGLGSGASVRFSDGAHNTLHNFSDLSSGGASVIVGGAGDDVIENNGLVVGSVDLGTGHNAFFNYSGGRVESGASLNLGAGNQFLNAGVLAPGGQNAIQPTALTGNFLQTSTGILQIKLGPGAVSDQLAVSGNALVGGTLSVSRFNGFLPTKGDQYTFLTAGQSLAGQFASLDDPLKGNYALMLKPVYLANSIALQTLQDSFLQFALTPNQRAVAQNLDSVSGLGTMSGDPREAPLINYLNTIPGSGLGVSFDLIAPEELGSLFDMSGGIADITALNVEARAQDLRSGHAEYGRFSLYDPHGRLDTPWAQQGDGSEPLPTEPSSKDWHPFAVGSAQIIDVENTSNASGYDIYTAGATLGVDHLASTVSATGLPQHTWATKPISSTAGG